MFVLVALICVLDDTPRGHHCDTFVYPTQFETLVECKRAKFREAVYTLPRRNEKMALGDCVYRQVKTVTM
jgi:hypothetical protein